MRLLSNQSDWENRMKSQEVFCRPRLVPRDREPPTDELLLRNAARWTHLHLGVVEVAKSHRWVGDYLEKPEQADVLRTRSQ
jgi:hypothetical protein